MRIKSNLGINVSKIKQINTRLLNKILLERNITAFNSEQGRILHVLWDKDGITSKELSINTGLAMNTLTSMLDRMENKKLIERKGHPSDRRKTLVFLTDYTKELKQEYKNISQVMIENCYSGFSDDEIEKCENYLERILINLEKFEMKKKSGENIE